MKDFFVFGFHVAIITKRLPTEFSVFGFKAEIVAFAFLVYGITTILGSVLRGGIAAGAK